MRFLPLMMSAMSAAMLLTACGAPRDPVIEATTLHRGNGAEPLTLDPHLASGGWENHIIGDMFMGLFTEDQNGLPIYGLATDHTVSEDALIWTFKLRKAEWSDGMPITAHDFVFSLRRILDPETLSQYAFMLYPLVGAEAINNAKALPNTLGVRAIDDYTLELTLNDPTPFLPGLLTHFTSYAVPAHVVAEHGSYWIRPENIEVSGAYKLVRWKTNDFVHITKNERFYDAQNVCLSNVYFYPTTDTNTAMRRVETGELHMNSAIPGKKIDFYRERLPGYVHTHPMLVSSYLVFNGNEPPFDNRDVRQALSMAIDREFIVNDVIQGGRVPSYRLVPPGIDNYVPSEQAPRAIFADWSLERRREEARRLLEGAGFGPNNPLNFEFSHRNGGDNPLATPVMQDSWNSIAPWVSATLQSVETQIHYDNLRTGNFQVGDAGWIADYNDPQNFLFLLETRTGQMNYGKYNKPEFDALLAKSAKIRDVAERAKVLADAEAIMLNDMPLAPTWFSSSANLVNPIVQGWTPNISDLHRSRYMCLDVPSELEAN